MPRVRGEALRESLRLARVDRLLNELLADNTYQLAAASPWTSVDDGSTIGVRLDLSLAMPQSVNSDVPHIVVPPDTPSSGNCKHPYSAGWLHAQADDVRGFMVLVDQLKLRIVEIDPRAHKIVYSWSAGRPRLTC